MMRADRPYPTGVAMLAGLVLGAALGALLSTALGVGVRGVPVGMAAGLALGTAVDSWFNDRRNPDPGVAVFPEPDPMRRNESTDP